MASEICTCENDNNKYEINGVHLFVGSAEPAFTSAQLRLLPTTAAAVVGDVGRTLLLRLVGVLVADVVSVAVTVEELAEVDDQTLFDGG